MHSDLNIQNKTYKDDEIDFFELFGTIRFYRSKIALITACFFVLGFIYVMVATPWYKATALVEIGFYKNPKDGVSEIVLAKTSEVVRKLELKYISLLEEVPEKDELTQSVTEAKNNPKFFNITTLGKSNELAVNLINKIVEDVANEHKDILYGYINSRKVALANVDRQIEFLKNNRMIDVKQQIKNIEDNVVPRKNRQIVYLKNTVIPLAKTDLESVDKIYLPSLDKRIFIVNENIAKYENELEKIKKSIGQINNKGDTTIRFIQEQNLNSQITSSRDRLVSLEQQREVLLTKVRIELQNRFDELVNVKLVDMQADLDKTLQEDIPSLQRQLYNLETAELGALLDQRSIVELSLQPHSYKNTAIVSEIITSQNPEKPKKLIILAASLLLGLIVSVFGVLIYDGAKKRTTLD